MKLITRNTDYAIRALCRMAGSNADVVSVSDLVKDLKIPRPFLRKLLQVLHKEGLLESFRGRGGGFKLAAEPADIYIYDIIKIFQGPLKLNECLFRKKLCPNRKNCRLKAKIDEIEGSVVSSIKTVTLAEIMD